MTKWRTHKIGREGLERPEPCFLVAPTLHSTTIYFALFKQQTGWKSSISLLFQIFCGKPHLPHFNPSLMLRWTCDSQLAIRADNVGTTMWSRQNPLATSGLFWDYWKGILFSHLETSVWKYMSLKMLGATTGKQGMKATQEKSEPRNGEKLNSDEVHWKPRSNHDWNYKFSFLPVSVFCYSVISE